MKAAQVRKAFLDYFAQREHQIAHSSSLVPSNDPTLLFTNAGMVPFKDVFTGKEKRDYSRACSSQKCVRAGGKHNDLDEVGRTARHHTFFEMLGNFSFGDYFKKDAVTWAWDLLVGHFGIDADRLVCTIFEGDADLGVGADDEARGLWKDLTGFGDDRIIALGMKDNFWMMGDTGPMGPCSEIHYWLGDEAPGPDQWAAMAAGDDTGWVELWNLVFMQYERREKDGPLHPLPKPSIDTGAGLERVTAVLQGKRSNYDTDLFTPLLAQAAEIAGKTYGANDKEDTSMRVIADHARATSFLVADGVFPEKTGREYVLRRIFRRAVRHGKLLGIDEPFMHIMCEKLIDEMKGAYPELAERANVIREVCLAEEKGFRRTLDRGLNLLEDEFAALEKAGDKTVTGDKVFLLYGTYGFPSDLTEIIANERGYGVDMDGFKKALEDGKDSSGAGGSDQTAIADIWKQLANDLPATEFLGYGEPGHEGTGTVLALVVDGDRATEAGPGSQVSFVCDKTPFYAESGGQIGDLGTATADGLEIRIIDCAKPAGDVFVHTGEIVRGTLTEGVSLTLAVDDARRARIRANHSATHLLHLALKKVLGDHVAQKGSLVSPDKLRFDFSHFSPVTADEKRQIEEWVNHEIRANVASDTNVLPLEEAKERGAVAMFGEKYGATVRVVNIGTESLEFCGGTHVRRTGDIGLFKLIAEGGIAQGVRRIEAVTGAGALAYLQELEDQLGSLGASLKVAPAEVPVRVDKLQKEIKTLEKEVAGLKQRLASGGSRDLMADLKTIGDVKVLVTQTEIADPKALREVGDQLRDKLGSGVLLLAGIDGERVALVSMVTKDLTKKFHAGKLLKAAAEEMGGRGGGRPDMAQGGAKDPSKVEAALAKVLQLVERA